MKKITWPKFSVPWRILTDSKNQLPCTEGLVTFCQKSIEWVTYCRYAQKQVVWLPIQIIINALLFYNPYNSLRKLIHIALFSINFWKLVPKQVLLILKNQFQNFNVECSKEKNSAKNFQDIWGTIGEWLTQNQSNWGLLMELSQ